MSRILIFSTAYFPFVGGAEVAMKEITDRLPQYEFEMITAKMKRELPATEKVGNILVHRVGLGIPMFDKFFLALFGGIIGARLHQQKAFAGAWSLMASYSGFAALVFHKKTGVEYLLTLQEGDPIEYILHKVRFVRGRFCQIFAKAKSLQAISHYLLKWGREMGFQGKEALVVPNGVDGGRFTQVFPKSELENIRAGFGFAKDAYIVVTASRLVIKNGVADVIRALPLLPENVSFVICGTGELEVSLRQLVDKLQLGKRVVFLGNCSHEELPKILHASDAFIRPSLTEGLGNSFLEAMAAGIPTIGTLVGGIPDFLTDGETGFACEPENPESIAQTIRRVMTMSPEEKKRVQENALHMVTEKYNWDLIVNQMNLLLKKL